MSATVLELLRIRMNRTADEISRAGNEESSIAASLAHGRPSSPVHLSRRHSDSFSSHSGAGMGLSRPSRPGLRRRLQQGRAHFSGSPDSRSSRPRLAAIWPTAACALEMGRRALRRSVFPRHGAQFSCVVRRGKRLINLSTCANLDVRRCCSRHLRYRGPVPWCISATRRTDFFCVVRRVCFDGRISHLGRVDDGR